MDKVGVIFNPNDWISSQRVAVSKIDIPILQVAENLISNSRNGEKHHFLCKASFLLGGYVGGNLISENEAKNCLRNAISGKNDIKNFNQAYKTIDKCIEAGKLRPIHNNNNGNNIRDNFQYFNYSEFAEKECEFRSNINLNISDFPIDVFPMQIQNLIVKANHSVGFPINFLASSILFAVSALIGNTAKIKVRSTQFESGLLYMVLVGAPGVNKSHPLKFALNPIYELEARFYEEYKSAKQLFDIQIEQYNLQKPRERISVDKPLEPIRNQIIVSDITNEALIEVHSENPKGLCMHRDELRGFFNDLNKYRKGSDLQQFLSIWNGFEIKSNRKTDSNSHFIQNPYVVPIRKLHFFRKFYLE